VTKRRRPALIFSRAVLLLCAVLGAGFSLDRPRHTDLGGLGWSEAFSRLCGQLAREYPFSAWKGIDWTAIERDLGPRVADAETRRDRRAWYRALRELVWRLRDGHARLLGDDGGLERAEVGGSFGLEVVELDDGRVLASRIADGGPAARAGLRFGAEIVRWNGKVGDFTSLKKLVGAQYGVKDGDVVEATIHGNVLKGFINGVEVISAEDDVFESGSPGIGFNFFVGNTNVDHGFTHFEVDTDDS